MKGTGMRIAVCDDMEAYRNLVANRIKGLYARRKLQVEVDRFGSGEELLAQCGTEKYDIVFTDISMPDMDGFELAEKISMMQPSVYIVFFTDYQNLVFESFQYHPVWFVRKSNLDNDLGNAIGEIERQMDYKGKMVTVSFRDKEHDYRTAMFKLADVYYMECNGHTITFFLEDGKVTTTGNLSDLEKEYAGQGFVRIHSKYLVNSRRISLLEKKNVVLEKGITLPLSRYRVKQVEIFMIRFGAGGR